MAYFFAKEMRKIAVESYIQSVYNNQIVKMSRHVHGLCGRSGDECRPAAGRNRGLGRRRASQNRDVMPGAWLTRMDGRVGASNPTAERRDGL